jgi:hypothetical protein
LNLYSRCWRPLAMNFSMILGSCRLDIS